MTNDAIPVAADELAELRRDAERYRWWRENIDAIEDDGDGITGVAYCYQVPMFPGFDMPKDAKEPTPAELMDAIADIAIVRSKS